MDPNVSIAGDSCPVTADGTLVIIVCRAKHLPNRRKLDKQTPYVTLRLGTTAKKTPSHFRAGQTPDWTHEIRFQLARDRKPVIRLDVLDETKGDPTPIGTCEIDGSVIFQPENQSEGKYIYDKWYDLSLNGRRAGMIYLEMTFYPSAPVLPPKLYESVEYENQFNSSSSSRNSNKGLPPPPPEHPSKHQKPTAADEVFVTGEEANRKSFFSNFNSSTHQQPTPLNSSGSSAEGENDVFVSESEQNQNIKQKYFSKFNKFKNKFQTKEPINLLWNGEERDRQVRAGHISPIDTKEFDNLEDLERDLQLRDIPPSNYNAHGNYERNHSPNNYHSNNQDMSFDEPPSPPAHSDYTPNPFPASVTGDSPSPPAHSVKYGVPGGFESVSPSPHSPAVDKTKSPSRKPPPDFQLSGQMGQMNINDRKGPVSPNRNANTTSIPFSADSIGLDDDERLPTKVYCMDKPIKSLSYSSLQDEPNPKNVNEIDPRYYAPTPGEHFKKNRAAELRHSRSRELDLRTKETGYLGNGQWDTKYSPSIFDKMGKGPSHNPTSSSPRVNDENLGFENKPHVPPKIPQGLSEQEYYVLEKEKYLQDINGRRM